MKNMTKVCEDVREIMHEWHTPKAERILHEMGVSKRNWRMLMQHAGFADGHSWSYRQIAAAEDRGLSHVRVFQIVRKTRLRLWRYLSQKGYEPVHFGRRIA